MCSTSLISITLDLATKVFCTMMPAISPTWSCYDPAYAALVGGKSPWALTLAEKQKVQEALLPAPKGGRWRFSNPARCLHCGAAISDSIERCIYYLLYDGSIQTQDLQRHDHNFG